LVGPASWLPTAAVLQRRGARCLVPTPAPAEPVTPWSQWSDALQSALGSVVEPILVGHSAAGLLLPALGHALNASALIFVDARVPPPVGRTRPVDGEFHEFVKALPTENGRLPPWSRWWGDGRIEALIPDPQTRAQFEAELPRLPLAWFDDRTDVPEWISRPCGYLRLSNLFEPETLDAVQRGWPVVHLDGTHLHPMLEPAETADALLSIVAALHLPG
jgi:Alpha/beta hydrolase family